MLWPPASLGYRPAAVLDLTAEERIEYHALLSCPCSLCPDTRTPEHTVTYCAHDRRSGVGKR